MQITPLIAQACDQIGELFDDLSSAPTTITPADIERWKAKAKVAEQTADRAQVAAMYVMSMFKNGPDSKNTKRLKNSLK